MDGCIIPKVPVDGGSGVNLMLEDTTFDLGYTSFEETNQILRMADQSRVIPAGRLSQVPTRIGEATYLQNFVIIRVSTRKPFPMLLGRPWLYSAKVLVDWGAKEYIVDKPPLRIPWKAEKHLGETCESDGYTFGWSDPEDSNLVPSYFVTEFSGATEEDFGFSNPIPEEGCQDIEEPGNEVLRPEDRSLGATDVPLTLKWIQGQVAQGSLPAIGLKEHQQGTSWSEIRTRTEESEPDPVKNIVSPTDYEKMEVEIGKTFYLGRTLNEEEKLAYSKLLKEFADIFAWSPSDLIGIPSTLGEHQIDLVNGATPVRQRQYRLNPRYSLMVKEEIDRLLEAEFIYPVSNSEWVLPIVVVSKKMGVDGKVKIRVC